MTEEEWHRSGDASQMIYWLTTNVERFRTRWQGTVSIPRIPVTDRQRALFIQACMFRIEDLLSAQEARQYLETTETFTKDEFYHLSWLQLTGQANPAWSHLSEIACRRMASTPIRRGARKWERHRVQREIVKAEMFEQANLLRDILGNPFHPRPAIDHLVHAWNDQFIPRLARQIYDSRRFADLPILADALEDAGCSDAAILSHCRGPGPHVRGCWVLDAILLQSR